MFLHVSSVFLFHLRPFFGTTALAGILAGTISSAAEKTNPAFLCFLDMVSVRTAMCALPKEILVTFPAVAADPFGHRGRRRFF